MKKHLILLILLFGATFVFQGCSRPRAGTIQIKGSDTMVNLGEAWAEAYAKERPNADITVTGGGSGVGIAALINGNTDIAEASREMTKEELDQAQKKGENPKQFVVARDGISVVVNPANPVSKLTVDQLSDIYTGKITNWKQVGGKDEEMVVLSRDKNSGTYVFFLEYVIRKGNAKGTEEYANTVLPLISNQAIAQEVAGNEKAIGYIGMGYVEKGKQKAIAVAGNVNSPYVYPTLQNVLDDVYPIARPLYFYTPKPPSGDVKEFINFVLSDTGQRIVEKLDFVPVRNIP